MGIVQREYGSPLRHAADGHIRHVRRRQIWVPTATPGPRCRRFSIIVLETAPATSGPAALSWTRPTQNTDGKALNDLAGYRVYFGTSPRPVYGHA